MKMTLNEQEIMNAISVYMYLKGFVTGDTMTFIRDRYGNHSMEVRVRPAKFDIKKIQEWAIKN